MPRPPSTPVVKRDTALLILDTAERLCGLHGLEAVSIRDIAAEAGVSIAVIYHHFGSKMNLLLAILETRFAEVRVESLQLLSAVEANPDPSVGDILRVILQPINRWRTPEREPAMQFYALALVCPMQPIREFIDGGVLGLRPIVDLLQRALPHLTHEDICWRLHFTMKITHETNWDANRLSILSNNDCHSGDSEESLARGIAFAEAAFLAPSFTFSKGTTQIPSKPKRKRSRK